MLNRLYPLILWLALPLVWVRLQLRARRDPSYAPRQGERFGQVPDNIRSGPIWFHTVSAGESIAAANLIRTLVEDNPTHHFLVTTMTPTGSEQVVTRLGDVVQHCYAPYDFTFAVRRFFYRVQPRMLVLMETELWPGLIRFAHAADIPVVLINARLSERSARGYARVSSITTAMLARVRLVACQAREHAERFAALGLTPQQLSVVGNVKYDLTLPEGIDAAITQLGQQFGLVDAPIWIAASTHQGEDEIVLAAHARVLTVIPQARLILVPRHPHRSDEVQALIEDRGWSSVRQSQAAGNAQVLIGDVMGTLLSLYGLAGCAFVGGSLVPVGGHNPIEPGLLKVPVLTGPEQFNFADAYQQLLDNNAARQVTGADELASAVVKFLQDPTAAAQAAANAAQVVSANTGATERTRALLQEIIDGLD